MYIIFIFVTCILGVLMYLQITVGVSPYAVQHGYSLASLDCVFIMMKRCHGHCLLMQFDLVSIKLESNTVFYFN
jgi:hypothetical protein